MVELNPYHFAAWQGLAACHVRLGEVEEACRAMRQALQIKPHDAAAQRFLRNCEDLFEPQPRRPKTQEFEA